MQKCLFRVFIYLCLSEISKERMKNFEQEKMFCFKSLLMKRGENLSFESDGLLLDMQSLCCSCIQSYAGPLTDRADPLGKKS